MDDLIDALVSFTSRQAPYREHDSRRLKSVPLGKHWIALARLELIEVYTVRKNEAPRSWNTGPLRKAVRRIAADRNKAVNSVDQQIRQFVLGWHPGLVAVDDEHQTRPRQLGSDPGQRQQIDVPAYHHIGS